jgi:hypothetical protein
MLLLALVVVSPIVLWLTGTDAVATIVAAMTAAKVVWVNMAIFLLI